ncbi:MAG TPA: regulator [Phycisphaerae bacterium]|nr:regulator [Phycisphaerae bacterium]HNU44517.1 regulator [Phycisphaerae bacterium]
MLRATQAGSGLVVSVLLLSGVVASAADPAATPGISAGQTAPAATPATGDPGLPFVYRRWEQFTTATGLPNDHVFAVRVHGDSVWIGTEDGLACLDKKSRKIKAWREQDGLPWRVISGIDVHPRTGEVWLGMFGGGLARFSGGRFDHWHQLNSGLVNDVVYGVAVENDNIWAATTAGASRYNTVTGEWSIFTEKNAPMEEIWNYGVCYADGYVYLGVWGSGVLEYDVQRGTWKDYLDPDGEMEIDLYRDDGIVHVITTGVSYIEKTLWVSTYFGACRYDGRHWRGFFSHECGVPSDFHNAVRARSANEAWYATDKGLGALADFATDTWVTYTSDHTAMKGKAVVKRGKQLLKEIEMPLSLPHDYALAVDFDGPDVWVGTSKGVGHAIGDGYYRGLRAAGAEAERGP